MSAASYEFPTLEASAVVSRAPVADQAHAILAAAQAEAEVVIAAAAEQGRAEGHAEGLAAAQAALEPARAALVAAVEELAAERSRVAAEAEAAAVELALALAEKVLGAALELRPELVLDVATGALRRTDDREHLVLQVNPDDLELVRACADDVAARLGGIGRLEVASERRVARGGCIVRTPAGEIDARIEEQLARAAEVLRESVAVPTNAADG
jgi:flagellar biosynthesis/type III secretory pathway protein FliH